MWVNINHCSINGSYEYVFLESLGKLLFELDETWWNWWNMTHDETKQGHDLGERWQNLLEITGWGEKSVGEGRLGKRRSFLQLVNSNLEKRQISEIIYRAAIQIWSKKHLWISRKFLKKISSFGIWANKTWHCDRPFGPGAHWWCVKAGLRITVEV